MKSFLFISILVLTFTDAGFAQTDEITPCPAIVLNGLTSVPKLEERIAFLVSLSREAKKLTLQYNWTISGGEVIEGQASSAIKVQQKGIGGIFIVTVKVGGLPQECAHTT